jgi:hypothetical protein
LHLPGCIAVVPITSNAGKRCCGSGTADKRYVEQNRRRAVDITAAKTPRAFIEEGVKITNGEIMDLSLFALIPDCIQQ